MKAEKGKVIFEFSGYLGIYNKDSKCYELFNPNGVLLYTYDTVKGEILMADTMGMDKVFIKTFDDILKKQGVFDD